MQRIIPFLLLLTAVTVEWDLKMVDYINKLDEDANVGIFASADVVETNQRFSDQDSFSIDKPDLEMKVTAKKLMLS